MKLATLSNIIWHNVLCHLLWIAYLNHQLRSKLVEKKIFRNLKSISHKSHFKNYLGVSQATSRQNEASEASLKRRPGVLELRKKYTVLWHLPNVTRFTRILRNLGRKPLYTELHKFWMRLSVIFEAPEKLSWTRDDG